MLRNLAAAFAVITLDLMVANMIAAGEPASTPQGRFAAAGLEEAQVRSFLEALQSAVRRGDARAVADLVSFPLTVNGHDQVSDRSQFVKRYSTILDPVVKGQILGQRVDALFANSSGVMIGKGVVWLSGICDDDSPPGKCKGLRLLIVAINHGTK